MNQSEELKNQSKSLWGKYPAGWAYGKEYKPGTKEFFDTVLQKRFTYEVEWLDEIVPFKQCKNKKILEIGSGAGYDAFKFCEHGADYTGIDLTPENPIIARQHLAYHGYHPTFIEMDVEAMTFNQQFDYVYSFGVLHHTPDIQKAFKNIYTSLKADGEFQVILYHKHSIFYWLVVIFSEWITRGGFLKRSLAEQRSLIEYSDNTQRPLVNVYSKKELCDLLRKTGFTNMSIDIRKLVDQDIKSIRFFGRVHWLCSSSLLQKLSKKFGWYISVRAHKH